MSADLLTSAVLRHLGDIAGLASELNNGTDAPVRAWMELIVTSIAQLKQHATMSQACSVMRCYSIANLMAIQQCSADRLRHDVPLEHTGVLVQRMAESRGTTNIDAAEIELNIKFGIPVRHILHVSSRDQQIRMWTHLVELLACVSVDQTIAAELADVKTKLSTITPPAKTADAAASTEEMTDIINRITAEQHSMAVNTGTSDLTSTKEFKAVVKGLTQFMPSQGEPKMQDAMKLVNMVQQELTADVDFSVFMKSIAAVAGGLISHGNVDGSNPAMNMFGALMTSVGQLPDATTTPQING